MRKPRDGAMHRAVELTFKVLDRFKADGKEQILLLHLPDNEDWHLFEGATLSIEHDLIDGSRERFLAK